MVIRWLVAATVVCAALGGTEEDRGIDGYDDGLLTSSLQTPSEKKALIMEENDAERRLAADQARVREIQYLVKSGKSPTIEEKVKLSGAPGIDMLRRLMSPQGPNPSRGASALVSRSKKGPTPLPREELKESAEMLKTMPDAFRKGFQAGSNCKKNVYNKKNAVQWFNADKAYRIFKARELGETEGETMCRKNPRADRVYEQRCSFQAPNLQGSGKISFLRGIMALIKGSQRITSLMCKRHNFERGSPLCNEMNPGFLPDVNETRGTINKETRGTVWRAYCPEDPDDTRKLEAADIDPLRTAAASRWPDGYYATKTPIEELSMCSIFTKCAGMKAQAPTGCQCSGDPTKCLDIPFRVMKWGQNRSQDKQHKLFFNHTHFDRFRKPMLSKYKDMPLYDFPKEKRDSYNLRGERLLRVGKEMPKYKGFCDVWRCGDNFQQWSTFCNETTQTCNRDKMLGKVHKWGWMTLPIDPVARCGTRVKCPHCGCQVTSVSESIEYLAGMVQRLGMNSIKSAADALPSHMRKVILTLVNKVTDNGTVIKSTMKGALLDLGLGCGKERNLRDHYEFFDQKEAPLSPQGTTRRLGEAFFNVKEKKDKAVAKINEKKHKAAVKIKENKDKAAAKIKAHAAAKKQYCKVVVDPSKKCLRNTKIDSICDTQTDNCACLSKKAFTGVNQCIWANPKTQSTLLDKAGHVVHEVKKKAVQVKKKVVAAAKYVASSKHRLQVHFKAFLRDTYQKTLKGLHDQFAVELPDCLRLNENGSYAKCGLNSKPGGLCKGVKDCLKTSRKKTDYLATLVQRFIHGIVRKKLRKHWLFWDLTCKYIPFFTSSLILTAQACPDFGPDSSKCTGVVQKMNEVAITPLDRDKPINMRFASNDALTGNEKCAFRYELDLRYRLTKEATDKATSNLAKCAKIKETNPELRQQCTRKVMLPLVNDPKNIDCGAKGGFVDRVIRGRIEKGGSSSLCKAQFLTYEMALRFIWLIFSAIQTSRVAERCMKLATVDRSDKALFLKGYDQGMISTCKASRWTGPLLVVCDESDNQVSQHKIAIEQIGLLQRSFLRRRYGRTGMVTVPGTTSWNLKSSRKWGKHGLENHLCDTECHRKLRKAMELWVEEDSAEYFIEAKAGGPKMSSGFRRARGRAWSSIHGKNASPHIINVYKKWSKRGTWQNSSADNICMSSKRKCEADFAAKCDGELLIEPIPRGHYMACNRAYTRGCRVHADIDAGSECAAACSLIAPKSYKTYQWKRNPASGHAKDAFPPASFTKSTAKCIQECTRQSLRAYTTSSGSFNYAYRAEWTLKTFFGPKVLQSIDTVAPFFCPTAFHMPQNNNTALCCKESESRGFVTYQRLKDVLKANGKNQKDMWLLNNANQPKWTNPCPRSHPYALEWQDSRSMWCYKTRSHGKPCRYTGNAPALPGMGWGVTLANCTKTSFQQNKGKEYYTEKYFWAPSFKFAIGRGKSGYPSYATSSDQYLEILQGACQASDDKVTTAIKKCDMHLVTTVTKLAMAGKFSQIGPTLFAKAKSLLRHDKHCLPYFISVMMHRSASCVSCYCSRYFNTMLNSAYSLDSSGSSTLMDVHSPEMRSDHAPRYGLHYGTILPQETYFVTGPRKVVLNRKLDASGNIVCSMWLTFQTKECQNGYASTNTRPRQHCQCAGGLMGRRIETGQIFVKAKDTTHQKEIQAADCGKWFVVYDAVARSIYAGLSVFAYMPATTCI